jgi:hypothetical protein
MTTRVAQIILGATILISIVGVIVCGELIAPVRKGTSAIFWQRACGVKISPPQDDILGGIYQPRDGFYIYYDLGYSGQWLFKVPRAEAAADFPLVVQKIKEMELLTNEPPIVHWAAFALHEKQSSLGLTPEAFLASIREQNLKRFKNSNNEVYLYILSEEQEFDKRWSKSRRFWLNQVFEVVFFTCWVWFIIWPWIRKRRLWRSLLHLALAPFLLFVPYYCGYASWTFTSVGPSGGAFYPFVIFLFHRFPIWTPLDGWLLEHSPKFLEALSQDQGSMLAISGGSGLGPVGAILIGLLIAAFAAAVFYCKKRLNLSHQSLSGNKVQL